MIGKSFWIHENRKKLVNFKNLKKNHHHAYLIIGPENTGKLTLALKLAQIFLESENIESHPDLAIIQPDNAKNPKISIADIKEVRNKAQLSASYGGSKVFIISSAEKMTVEAQNALLKTLEEPAEKTIFILTVTSEKLLLPTILSRCQKIKIPLLPQQQIKNYLNIKELKKAEIISRLSLGKVGLALKISENQEMMTNILEKFKQIIKVIKDKNLINRFQKANEFSNPQSFHQYAECFEVIFRDLLHLKIGSSQYLINFHNQSELAEISANYTIEEIVNILKEIKKIKLSFRQNVNPKFAFENLILML